MRDATSRRLRVRDVSPSTDTVSGLDDLFYDVWLTDASAGELDSGTVTVKLCTMGTTTALGGGSSQALTHVGGGRWTATHDAAGFLADLPAVGRYFDRVLFVTGQTDGRLLARCKRVAIIDERT